MSSSSSSTAASKAFENLRKVFTKTLAPSRSATTHWGHVAEVLYPLLSEFLDGSNVPPSATAQLTLYCWLLRDLLRDASSDQFPTLLSNENDLASVLGAVREYVLAHNTCSKNWGRFGSTSTVSWTKGMDPLPSVCLEELQKDSEPWLLTKALLLTTQFKAATAPASLSCTGMEMVHLFFSRNGESHDPLKIAKKFIVGKIPKHLGHFWSVPSGCLHLANLAWSTSKLTLGDQAELQSYLDGILPRRLRYTRAYLLQEQVDGSIQFQEYLEDCQTDISGAYMDGSGDSSVRAYDETSGVTRKAAGGRKRKKVA